MRGDSGRFKNYSGKSQAAGKKNDCKRAGDLKPEKELITDNGAKCRSAHVDSRKDKWSQQGKENNGQNGVPCGLTLT